MSELDVCAHFAVRERSDAHMKMEDPCFTLCLTCNKMVRTLKPKKSVTECFFCQSSDINKPSLIGRPLGKVPQASGKAPQGG